MTYTTNANSLRLGISVWWNSNHSPRSYQKKVRFSIVLNILLKGFLKYMRMKLVKWSVFIETGQIKLVVLFTIITYSELMKFRFRRRKKTVSKWNYFYFDKFSYELKQLQKFHTSRTFQNRVKLGSGRFWSKHFRTIFFFFGKKRQVLKQKFFKKTKECGGHL